MASVKKMDSAKNRSLSPAKGRKETAARTVALVPVRKEEAEETMDTTTAKPIPPYVTADLLLRQTMATIIHQCQDCSSRSRAIPMKVENGDIILTIILCPTCMKACVSERYNVRNNIIRKNFA